MQRGADPTRDARRMGDFDSAGGRAGVEWGAGVGAGGGGEAGWAADAHAGGRGGGAVRRDRGTAGDRVSVVWRIAAVRSDARARGGGGGREFFGGGNNSLHTARTDGGRPDDGGIVMDDVRGGHVRGARALPARSGSDGVAVFGAPLADLAGTARAGAPGDEAGPGRGRSVAGGVACADWERVDRCEVRNASGAGRRIPARPTAAAWRRGTSGSGLQRKGRSRGRSSCGAFLFP